MGDTTIPATGETRMGRNRWTDHWQVKALIGIVLFFITTTTPGLVWIVGRAVVNETKDAQQDVAIQTTGEQFKEFREEQRQANRRIEDKLDAMRDHK
jgi:Sec-independent protein translocase protein TatA